jgi:hypothetical protein
MRREKRAEMQKMQTRNSRNTFPLVSNAYCLARDERGLRTSGATELSIFALGRVLTTIQTKNLSEGG